jgi:hypothetical protein
VTYSENIERKYGVDMDDPMRKPEPSGYRKPRMEEYVGFAYVCIRCGSNVSPSATGLHDEWHAALDE